MQAYVLTRHGRPDVLTMRQVAEPETGPGEVRVRIERIGINYAEILSRKGLYGWAPRLPYIPGMEAFGTVDRVGAGVDVSRIGTRVVVGTQFGCYAEYVVIPEPRALPALNHYSPEENAAFAVNYMTAWISLFEMARLRPTDVVLVQAAAGGVGSAAVQLAKKFGCVVYGTVGSEAKIEILKKLQIDGGINYRRVDFEEEINRITNHRGVDVVLETVGGEVYKKSLRLLKPFGRVVVTGFASLDYKLWNPVSLWKTWRAIPRANVAKMAQYSYGVLSSHLGYLLQYPDLMSAVWNDLVAFVHRHRIRPVVGKVFSFDELPRAHEWMESRRSHGKLVIRV